jgi:hypothetical protein
LFEYPIKIQNGEITIHAGELPTPGSASPRLRPGDLVDLLTVGNRHALDREDR